MLKKEEDTSAAKILKNFHDGFGWQIDPATGMHHHHTYFQDMDEVAVKYRYTHELRFKPSYSGGGHYFLDAGCGGEPRSNLSEGFDVHLCLDLSIEGLKAARDQLGGSGEYVVADLSYLPLKSGSFDGVLASHCLYHVDKKKQKGAIEELYRVTKNTKFILVLYSSRYNLISMFHKIAAVGCKWWNVILHLVGLHVYPLPPYLVTRRQKTVDSTVEKTLPILYSFAHNPTNLSREYPVADVSCLMSFSIYDTKLLEKLGLLGIGIRLFDFLENRFPHAMRHVGKFTCIRIQKRVDLQGFERR